jgi:hypothetical protein
MHSVAPEIRSLAQQFDWEALLELSSWSKAWASPVNPTVGGQVHTRSGLCVTEAGATAVLAPCKRGAGLVLYR